MFKAASKKDLAVLLAMARWKETSLILFPKRPFSHFLLGHICHPWDPFNLLNNCINLSGEITHFQALSLPSCVKSFWVTLQMKGSQISWDIWCQYFWQKQPASEHYLWQKNPHLNVFPLELCQVIPSHTTNERFPNIGCQYLWQKQPAFKCHSCWVALSHLNSGSTIQMKGSQISYWKGCNLLFFWP